MKVVALCNKLTRSRTLLKDGAAVEDSDTIDKPKTVVSNMTSIGKTAEVRIKKNIFF